MQIHFCFIYGASGLSKLQGGRWWNGFALWEIVSNYTFTPLNVPIYHDAIVFLCQHRWLWEIVMEGGVLFTLALEIFFPVLVWLPKWRPVMVSSSILLHTGIGMIMGLTTFGMFMFLLVGSFIPPDAYMYILNEIRNLAPGSQEGEKVTDSEE